MRKTRAAEANICARNIQPNRGGDFLLDNVTISFWDRSVGRKDSRSIRIESDGARREIFPVGAVCKFPPGTRCRLEGWIRTRNARGATRLELAVFEYSYGNIHAKGLSPAVKGAQPWTRVVAEVDLGEFACVLPTLVLEGPGIAWFDDLQLTAAP